MNYTDKLRDPRWQKRRLEIMQRDDFTCQSCQSKTKTLHVHHCLYMPGEEPWEARADSLVTLCEDCHSFEGAVRQEVEVDLLGLLADRGWLAQDLAMLYVDIRDGKVQRQPHPTDSAVLSMLHESVTSVKITK